VLIDFIIGGDENRSPLRPLIFRRCDGHLCGLNLFDLGLRSHHPRIAGSMCLK
jgi:hypothetical protein